MFTDSAHQLIENAKRDAWAQGEKDLTAGALLGAAAQHAEGRVLLARWTGVPVEKLREQFPAPSYRATLLTGRLPLSEELKAIIARAREFASQAPDRVHPGLIDIRHITAALALAPRACELLGCTPKPERDVVALLRSLCESDAGVPMLGKLASDLRALRARLLEKVFGQDHAVQAFVEGLFNAEIVAHADIERKRPSALFVFAGPPGVGKTYLAELGAAALGRPYQRFDMSSFSDHQSYLTLVGFAPSYQAAKGGLLTEFVAQNPNAFLLFDEIEKAHLNTVHLFLQILDAGQLEDKFTSQNVPFRDTTIIFTTNAGASLYDRPNETGVTTANASFHRRTLLDALRAEKGPGGQPFFPGAICSRMATGYPILFNQLGVNELERVARAEIDRVGGLLEQQYYKSVTCDEMLPLALVLREGAATDARTVRSQSALFVQSELFKFTELYTKRRLDSVWERTDTIHFEVERPEGNGDDAASLFEPPGRPRVLVVATEDLSSLFQRQVNGVEWLVASTAKDAMQILANSEVDLVLLDIWLGRSPTALTIAGTVGQFDFAPPAASALAEGQECLRSIHDRLSGLPVFLLSLAASDEDRGTIDESLFMACMRSGGARGLLTTAFTNDSTAGWEEHRDRFTESLAATLRRLYREKKVKSLGQERKVLAFDTVPAVDRVRRQVTIRLRNLRLARAVAAEDTAGVLSDVERPNVRFADVIGAESAKEAMQFIVEWLKNPRRYAALGVRPPKGVLLTGSPGTGKTILARALAGESDVAFLVASGTDFVTKWQGSGPENIRDLFSRARRYAPSVVFIDEIDAIGKKRMGLEGGSRAEESTLNALLTQMDGFGGPTLRPVIVLAATNLVEHLDEALRRRFDREIEVPPPDRGARAAFLRGELLGRKASDVTERVIDEIAGRSAGMTIANLRRVVNEAAVMAAKRESPLTDAIVEEAFEKIRMGEAGKTPDAATLERIARHEAGHAIVGWYTGNPPVQVTIVGRGSAGGYVEKEAQEDKIIYTRADLENMIGQAMGGRAAEMLYYGDAGGLSTGVGSDLRMATQWAERMICEFGMSDELGQVYVNQRTAQEGPVALRVSELAERVVRGQLDRAKQLLASHRISVDRLSAELLARNRLTRADLERLLGETGK